jgi:uncharacterized protein YjiS (DUF1127 family)
MTDTTYSQSRFWPRARNPFRWIMARRELARQRHALRHLDPKILDDIGITREQALREADRPTWDVPAHWLTD